MIEFKSTYMIKKEIEKLPDVKTEKDMTGKDILQVLLAEAGGFLTRAERCEGGRFSNPFDLSIGDERDQKMTGIEIKGDTDTFKRLRHQLPAYFRVFDEVYIALHKKKVPEWLPEGIGVLRVRENGRVYTETHSHITDHMDISSDWDWDSVLKANEIQGTPDIITKAYKAIANIRRNVLFNRLFAHQPWGNKAYTRFYKLTDYQKSLLIGFNIPAQLKAMNRDV